MYLTDEGLSEIEKVADKQKKCSIAVSDRHLSNAENAIERTKQC